LFPLRVVAVLSVAFDLVLISSSSAVVAVVLVVTTAIAPVKVVSNEFLPLQYVLFEIRAVITKVLTNDTSSRETIAGLPTKTL